MKKISWVPVALYVLAVIFGVYAIFALFSTASYIGEMVSSGYVSVSESFADIVAYFLSNVGAYLFYAIAFWFMGFAIKLAMHACPASCTQEVEVEDEEVKVEDAEVKVEAVSAVASSTPGPKYCTKCYKVFKWDEMPDVCPECGNPMK